MGKGGAIRWTPEMLAEHQAKMRQNFRNPDPEVRKAFSPIQPPEAARPDPAPTGKAKLQALGRLRDGSMNKTESRYAQHLDVLKHQGAILWWAFEGIKLRLADRTHLTVDFSVLTAEGMLQMHDVKGTKAIVEDDARAKTKIAARLFPFAFFMVYPDKASGGWTVEAI